MMANVLSDMQINTIGLVGGGTGSDSDSMKSSVALDQSRLVLLQ